MSIRWPLIATSVAALFLAGSVSAATVMPPGDAMTSTKLMPVVEGSPAPETADREDEEFLTDEEAEERDDLDGKIGREDIGDEEEDDEDHDAEESEENGGGQQHAFELENDEDD